MYAPSTLNSCSKSGTVRVLIAGVCNTDLEILKGYMGFTGVLGHEFVGVCEKTPKGSEHLVGKRVVGVCHCWRSHRIPPKKGSVNVNDVPCLTGHCILRIKNNITLLAMTITCINAGSTSLNIPWLNFAYNPLTAGYDDQEWSRKDLTCTLGVLLAYQFRASLPSLQEINLACAERNGKSCKVCSEGGDRARNHCPNRTVLGILHKDGTYAHYLTLPVDNLHIVSRLAVRNRQSTLLKV